MNESIENDYVEVNEVGKKGTGREYVLCRTVDEWASKDEITQHE